ncbi:MAG: hypothetical protein AAF806_30505 [Bacteroidota bacterium]
MKLNNIIFSSLLLLLGLSSCIENELPFDVIESPVLAVFEDMEADSAMIKIKATFYELDKSGILDKDVGIDSTAISGLPIGVFIQESTLIQELTTDADGVAIFEVTLDELGGNNRLEYVGNYKETPFRIYKKF